MDGLEDDGVGFQQRNEVHLNCPSSGVSTRQLPEKVSGLVMGSASVYKSAIGADNYLTSGWDQLVSTGQGESFGASALVSHSEFSSSPYSVLLENQGAVASSHLVHYPSDSSYALPKRPCFRNDGFPEVIGSFGQPECGQIADAGYRSNFSPNKHNQGGERASTKAAQNQEGRRLSEMGATGSSPDGNRRKRPSHSSSSNPNTNVEGDLQQEESSDALREQAAKKPKGGHSAGGNTRTKPGDTPPKEISQSREAQKDDYIHVRARRGQATNSHSLAERVRREKISERMRLLQELVPGCNKITGKAVMLDEIINYVQSLQQQVEFLSMKLATVNPELNFDVDRLLSKDILHLRGGNGPILGFGHGSSSSHPFTHGMFQLQSTIPSIPGTSPQLLPLPQSVLDNELQKFLQMEFDPNSAINNSRPGDN